jgi:tripartite-type tricarboxylate transporter receptor subunit TctC
VATFAPVALLASVPLLLVVPASLPARSVAELVALARSRPGQLNFASTGNGTAAHLVAEMFKAAARIDITHVPFGSPAQLFTELLAGGTSLMFYPYLPVQPHIETGKLVPLATTSAARLPWMAQLPTMAEGGLPGVELSAWFAVYAPAGTPAPVVKTLTEALRRVIGNSEVQATLIASDTLRRFGGPAELAAFTATEVERRRQIIAAAGVQVD